MVFQKWGREPKSRIREFCFAMSSLTTLRLMSFSLPLSTDVSSRRSKYGGNSGDGEEWREAFDPHPALRAPPSPGGRGSLQVNPSPSGRGRRAAAGWGRGGSVTLSPAPPTLLLPPRFGS